MRVEEMIGQRIRARRDELELSQSQLGKHLGELLGREWPRQAVSAAERGQRSFTAAELVALAFSLQTSVSGLLTPRADVTDVELSDRTALPREAVVASVLPQLAGMARHQTFDEMQDTLGRMAKGVIATSEGLGALTDDIQLVYKQLIRAMEVTSLEGQAAVEGASK